MSENLEYIRIFGSSVSIFIIIKKHTKSNMQKTWKNIFISYTRISKHLRVWAFSIYQVFIASKPIINEMKRSAGLLLKYLLPSSKKAF